MFNKNGLHIVVSVYVTKMYMGVEVELHSFLNSELDRGEWSVSRLRRFTTEESAFATRCIAGCMFPRNRLEA